MYFFRDKTVSKIHHAALNGDLEKVIVLNKKKDLNTFLKELFL